MPYFTRDDIAQIGTAPANALVGVLRVSGPNAFAILKTRVQGIESVFEHPKRAMHNCRFLIPLTPIAPVARRGRDAGTEKCDVIGQTVSEPENREMASAVEFACPARVLLMPGPHSYTTEDVAEIHVPGSLPVLKAALGALVAAGARPAAPGEFTFRAFRGGRVNLRQAEAVEEVIRAGNDAERRRALTRLGDATEGRIRAWRDRLADCAALVEAALDFSEEELDDQAFRQLEAIMSELDAQAASIVRDDCDVGEGLAEAALVGLANAGKSSLANALLGADTALVSPEASTTRDSIKREVFWNGIRFILSDNPGFDPEGAGAGGAAAARASGRMGGYDLAVWVVDASRRMDAATEAFAATLPAAVVAVLNKIDRPVRTTREELREVAWRCGVSVVRTLSVSAQTGEGLEELKAVIADRVSAVRVAGPWSRREVWELAAARECCRSASEELAGAGRLELAADDLRYGVAAFSRALGEGYAEDTLARIFSRFCIGK